MANNNEIKLRKSLVILFAAIQLKHELIADNNRHLMAWSRATLNARTAFPLQMLKLPAKHYSAHLEAVAELEAVIEQHPCYLESLGATLISAHRNPKSTVTHKGAKRWTKAAKLKEIKFLFSLVSLVTGPNESSFQSSDSKIDSTLVLNEALYCLLDFEEQYGSSPTTYFYHMCLMHFKTVNSTAFRET